MKRKKWKKPQPYGVRGKNRYIYEATAKRGVSKVSFYEKKELIPCPCVAKNSIPILLDVRLIRIIKSIGIVERKKSSDRWEHIYWIIYKNRTFQGWSWCFVYNIQKCPSLFFESSSRLFPNILFFFFLFPLYIFSLSQPRFRSKSLWFTILIRGWFSKCGQAQIALLTRHKVPRRLISNNIP